MKNIIDYREAASEAPGNLEALDECLLSFPGSAWERTVFEAPPRALLEAEPGLFDK